MKNTMMTIDEAVRAKNLELANLLLANGRRVAAAESLTGGMICSGFVDIPGSSNWFSYGFVTYSDEAKHRVLGVDAELIVRETAVSRLVAAEMAMGARMRSGADYAVAVTGLAGPGMDEFSREAGLVYIGIAAKSGYAVREFHFHGTRNEIRKATNLEALKLLINAVREFG